MIDAINGQDHDLEGSPARDREFAAFVERNEPDLRRALTGAVGVDYAHDAVADALVWALENWTQARELANPVGYLYRIAQRSTRVRLPKRVKYLLADDVRLPDVEPALAGLVAALPRQQRSAVWLIYACDWSYAEAAEAMEISISAVGTHAARGLARLRTQLGDSNG